MTPQIARIAATRLPHRPRPLRLSYAGQVLRVRASQMRPERQIGQVGAELIGAAGPAADVEAIAVAGEALTAVGVPHLSVDITLPTLVPAIAEAYGIAGERGGGAARRARPQGCRRGGARLAGEAGGLLVALVAAAGLAEAARAALDRLDLPERAAHRARPARRGARRARRRDPGRSRSPSIRSRTAASSTTPASALRFSRGSIRSLGPLGELGRGGRYEAGDPAAPEPATGFTLYTDTILRTLPEPTPRRRVLVPFEADRARARALREEGWITVAALQPASDWRDEARRLGCGHVLDDGERASSHERRWSRRSEMANVAVVGAQWGDEGKGKIVDWLSERADVVVRFQGGHNAGHTLVVGNVEYKLSLLPSGVVRPGKLSIIGNGVVVDPWALLAEIETMRGKGLDDLAAKR